MTRNNSAARRKWRASRIPLIRAAHKKWEAEHQKIWEVIDRDGLTDEAEAMMKANTHYAGTHRLYMQMTADYKPGTFAGDRETSS